MTLPSGISFSSDHKVHLPDRFNVAMPFIDRHVAEGRGAKAAIRTAEETVTYAELAERVNRAGNALLGLGLKPGDRLLMVVKDCPAFFYLFWGAIKAGIVPVPPNTLLRAPDYAYMIEDFGLRPRRLFHRVRGRDRAGAEAVAGPGAHGRCLPGRRWPQASDELEPRLAAPTDDCFWLYSSGSTGRPKGAVHAQRDMVVTSELYGVRVLGVGENDISYSAAKLFFAYGLGNGMTFPLWTGSTAVLDDRRPTPDTTFENIERFRPTLYYGVPTLYAAQLVALETRPRDLSCMRACVSAGEALPADIFRRWKEKTGTVILDGIGSTEALHIFIGNRLDDYRPGTSGKPVPGYEARILDENGKPVARGRERRAVAEGRVGRQVLLEQAGEDGGDHGRRLAQHRRHLPPGRRRLFHLRGPQRRHAEGRRHLVLAGRDRELPDRPSRRARGRRRGPGRRAELIKPKAIVVLKQAGGAHGTCRAHRGADGALQEDAWRPTNTRAGSSTCPSCPRPRPARSSASNCVA